MSLDHRPAGLLLDFGGVIFETRKRETGVREVAEHVQEMLTRGRHDVSLETLENEIRAGQTGLKHWKHSSSRRPEPTELTHREVVGEYLLSRLPEGARELVIAEAEELLATVSVTMSDHVVRPGIPELLTFCREQDIPVGIVSNAHAGLSHRRLLDKHGLTEFFGVQVYSDEVGIRKPHPRMIGLAAEALHVAVADCWYVGDTQDRDVVAGRQAGVGAVVLTRSKHTDNPPFPVADEADAIFDTPEGLLDALRDAAPHRPVAETPPTPAARAALLIDHGGVVSTSRPNEAALDELAADIAARIPTSGTGVEPASVRDAMRQAREVHKQHKQEWNDRFQAGMLNAIPEQQAKEFWGEVNELLGSPNAAWFEAEAQDLMHRFGKAKSARTLRPGFAELLRHCRDLGMPIVVVSNTISGRNVRAECIKRGIDDMIAAYVCSDEIGVRKPTPEIFEEALAIAGADPSQTWFLGDKAMNDAEGAQSVGIAHRALIRGGSTADEALDLALRQGSATLIVDSPTDLMTAITTTQVKE